MLLWLTTVSYEISLAVTLIWKDYSTFFDVMGSYFFVFMAVIDNYYTDLNEEEGEDKWP